MRNTALGAEKAIIFISDAHEKFYYEKLKVVRMAFNFYCSGMPGVPDSGIILPTFTSLGNMADLGRMSEKFTVFFAVFQVHSIIRSRYGGA